MSTDESWGEVTVNHVGQCVADLARSRRFYEELFGFEFESELRPPDDPSAQLLGLDPPLGLTAVYLRRGPFVLELLHYRDRPPRGRAARTLDEPGLTHLSLTVDNLTATLARVEHFGGTVLPSTNVGAAAFVRDPDGQLVELLSRRRP